MTILLAMFLAAAYPTNADEQDKLCEAIGKSAVIAVTPRDRVWFKEHCDCPGLEGLGCGRPKSKRFDRRIKAYIAASDAKRAKAERERAAMAKGRADTEPLRSAFWSCTVDLANPSDCEAEKAALVAACEAAGLLVGTPSSLPGWDDCYRR